MRGQMGLLNNIDAIIKLFFLGTGICLFLFALKRWHDFNKRESEMARKINEIDIQKLHADILSKSVDELIIDENARIRRADPKADERE